MDEKYNNIPGVNYETIAWDDTVEYKLNHTCGAIGKSGKSKGQVCGKPAFFDIDGQFFCRIHDPEKKTRGAEEKFQKKDVKYSYTIVQPHKDADGNVVNKGVVPALLEELYAARKSVKKEMFKAQAEGDNLLADILSGQEKGIKVSLNSIFGFLSRNRGNLIMKPLGQLTTAIGRMLIEQSKEYAEGPFLEYVRENNLVTYQLGTKEVQLTEKERKEVIKRFKVK